MSQVLYRQYRPQTFSQVVNQEVIVTTLQNAVRDSAVAHAYLFTGPRGVGKTSVARILAKAVNCQKPRKGEPCDDCGPCTAIRNGIFLDLIEIDAASHTGVDNIREIIEHVKFSPSSGKYKVIVIDEAHMLSKGAFNALLKTLEEPPAHALFVLATTEVSKVPATIVSRTQQFYFKLLSQADIVKRLSEIAEENKFKIAEEILKLVARAAGGSMRDGLSLLDQLISFSSGKITLEQAEEILGLTSLRQQQDFFELAVAGQTGPAIKFLKGVTASGRDITQFANGFLEYLDIVLSCAIVKIGNQDLGLTEEDFEILKKHAGTPQEVLLRLTELFLSAAQKIKYSPLPELPLELAVIEFARNSGSSPDSIALSHMKEKEAVELSTKKAVNNPADNAIMTQADGDDDFFLKINRDWNKFLTRVRDYNHSLISSLTLASVVSCDAQKLVLAFPYRFHKETLEQRKNKIVLEKVLEEVYGRPLKLECKMNHDIIERHSATKDKPAGLMEEALKVFRTAGDRTK